MRKIAIGLMALAVAVSVFSLYSRFNKTPQIVSSTFTDTNTRSDLGSTDDVNQILNVGDVGVGPAQNAKYVSYDENKQIQSETGFKKLLHKQGNVLEVVQPYRNIYRPDFSCYMTADKGIVEVATSGGATTIKDLTFSENVVIRILPGKSSDIQESYIFLDDIMFVSDRSLISTAGPVRFMSHDIQMTGKGLEIIYDSQKGLLEYCRIADIESLQAKVPQTAINTNNEPGSNKQPTASEKSPNVTIDKKPLQNQYYKCLFSRNVLINTQEQLIFSAQDFLINDIMLKQISERTTASADKKTTDANNNHPGGTAQTEPNKPAQQLVDITITCDDGITIMPQASAVQPKATEQNTVKTTKDNYSEKIESFTGQIKLLTQKLTYSIPTGDAVAAGKTEVKIRAKDSNSANQKINIASVTITSEKNARFLKAANQIIFDGNCLCKIPQQELSEQKDATLSSASLTVILPKDWSSEQSKTLPDITAKGPAQLEFFIDTNDTEKSDASLMPVKITAQNWIKFLSDSNQVVFDGDSLCLMGSENADKNRMVSLKSPQLTVNLPAEKSGQVTELTDIIAAGPAELKFYVDDISGTQPPKTFLPAKITAQKNARLLAASNQVVFEGPCTAVITRDGSDVTEEFRLTSATMTADIPKDINELSASSPAKLKHLTAEGEQVILSATKKAVAGTADSNSEKLLGGIQIKCRRLDYDGQEGVFLATGPGDIILNESQAQKADSNGIKPDKHWWAWVDNFETLKYQPEKKRIEAFAADGKTLSIKHTIIENGKTGPVVSANAGRADMELAEAADGKMELSKLFASGGIDYKDDKNHFIGSRLTYDLTKSIITVEGDSTQPCYCNGALVDSIKFDLANKNLEFKGVGPGLMQIP